MLTKSKAIVLRTLKLGENKMIVDMLTLEEGRVSCVVGIPKTQKGKLKRPYFQPLTLLEVELDLRAGRDLQHLRDARIAVPLPALATDARKLSIALFLAEVLYYSTREERKNEPLFGYIEQSLQWLDGCQDVFANFHLVFLMRLTRFIGFFPYTDNYHEGDWFDLRGGCFVANAPIHADFLAPADAARIGTLLRMDYASMHLFRMSHDDRNRIVEVIVSYYRLHVPAFPELRSLAVMKQLW